MLTQTLKKRYAFPALAKSGAGIDNPQEPRALARSHKGALFLCLLFMVGFSVHLRVAAFRGAVLSTPISPPPYLVQNFISWWKQLPNSGVAAMYDASRLLDIQDDLDRLLSQTGALVNTLIANDHFTRLDKTSLSELLWLVSERMRDIAVANTKLRTEVMQ